VEDVYELGAVDSVAGGEAAPREDAQLQELGDRLILGRPCRQAVTMSCVFKGRILVMDFEGYKFVFFIKI